jgi:CelD/BcsL family acetyltransferase involved in cellulose biosynthesis
MYTVRTASIAEFKESRVIWNKLAAAMSLPSIFCTWEWIYTWWEHFGDNYNPAIFFVFKGAELKGILPLASQDTILNRAWLTGRILTYCGSMEVAPDHVDIIASPEDAPHCLAAINAYLSTEYTEWDVLHLSHVSEASRLITWINDAKFSFRTNTRAVSVSPFITLTEGFDKYFETFNSKKRYNFKRIEKKLNEQYGIKYYSYDTLKYEEALDTLFALHEQRAKRKKIESTFNKEHFVKFHHDVVRRMAATDWVWFKVLGNDERVISVLYGFAFGKKVDYYQIGFDTEWEQHSPGTVLMLNVIKEAFSKNYEEFDFLRGSEQYKSHWTKQTRALFIANIYNKTLRGILSEKMYNTKAVLKNAKKLLASIKGDSAAAK